MDYKLYYSLVMELKNPFLPISRRYEIIDTIERMIENNNKIIEIINKKKEQENQKKMEEYYEGLE